VNLRCWEQKRRFGIDFLYPIERYRAALTDAQVHDRHGNVVTNPIFSDLNTNDDVFEVRDERLVVLTAIVGVPWQDIARRNGAGVPNLIAGLDANGAPRGAFQSAAEMNDTGTWSLILGTPDDYHTKPGALPADPLMVETYEERSGVHPIIGETLAPPGAAANANSINGHEYSIPQRDDLQYACVFDLPEPRDCTDLTEIACDCVAPNNDNPLCQNELDQFGTTQYRAKAYPGIRHLSLARALGERGTLGSICPAQLDDPNALSFGYAPAISTLAQAVTTVLQP
jgi:hypothetical protein